MLKTTKIDARHTIYTNRYWLLFLAFLIINFTIHRGLTEPGLILAGDFTRPENFGDFVRASLFPSWSEYSQSSNILRLHQLSIYAPAVALSSVTDLPSTWVYLVYFMVFGSIAGVFIFRLTEYLMQREKMQIRYEFVFAAAILYLFGATVVETAFHPGIAFALYLSPVLLYAVIRGVEEDKIRYLLLSSFIFSFVAIDTHFLIFGPIIFLSYILYDMIYRMVIQRRFQVAILKRAVLYSAIIIVPGLLLNSYWIIPAVASGGLDLYSTVLTKGDSTLLYRNTDILNVLSGKGFFNLQEVYPNSLLGFSYDDILSIILTIVALPSLYFYRRNKLVIFLGIIFVTSVVISIVPRYLPDLYNWFMFDVPFNSIYSWAFRAPAIHHFVSLSIAPLIAFSGMKFYETIKAQNRIIVNTIPSFFVIFVFVFSIIPNYILLTGDFNGNHKIYDLPQDYVNLISYLGEQDRNYNSVWGPTYSGLSTTWTQGRISSNIFQQVSPLNVFAGDWATSYYVNPLIFGIRFPYGSMVAYNDTSNIDDFLAPINVKYILIHNDVPVLENRVERTLQVLDSSDDLQSKQFGSITLYEIEDAVAHTTIKNHAMLIQGGLSRYESTLHIDGIDPRDIGVFFSDIIGPPDNLKMLDTSDIIIAENEMAYAEYILGQNDVIALSPFDHVDYFNPSTLWSKSAATDPSFLNNYRAASERTFQSDYGRGIIFTFADDTETSFPLSVNNSGDYRLLTRYLANARGGMVNLSIGDQSLQLNATHNLNRFVWADLGTFTLPQGTQKISIESEGGFNAINLLALVPTEKYDEYKNEFIDLLQDKKIIYILEAESDFYRTAGRDVRQISNLGYSNGEAIVFSPIGKAWGEFEILRGGEYNLSIRGNGTLDVSVDNGTFAFRAEADQNENHILQLDAGYHTIEFSTRVRGPDRPYLDYISLSPATDTGSSLLSNQITNYYKIDATNYEVNVKATSPYILAFAEAYDKGWIAEAKTPQGVVQYKPIPLYGVINGFLIDAEGEYPVTIRYEPQTTFYYSSAISFITYAVVGVYLIYPFLKSRNIFSAPSYP